jgi:uncharacterized protein YqjF (DUF2071 family)
MTMRWHDLLFAHWPVDPARVAPLLPPGIELETWDGTAWIGLVPFTMSGVRLRPLPPLPGSSAFAEVNVRTYVRAGGRSGVWFFSLDAASRGAVEAARFGLGLPYLNAEFDVRAAGKHVDYRVRRTDGRAAAGALAIRYRPIGPADTRVDPFSAWLTARFSMFSERRGRLLRTDIVHGPWPLARAAAEIDIETLVAADGLRRPDTAPILHFARRLDVRAWPPVRVRAP